MSGEDERPLTDLSKVLLVCITLTGGVVSLWFRMTTDMRGWSRRLCTLGIFYGSIVVAAAIVWPIEARAERSRAPKGDNATDNEEDRTLP